jgi:serine/threonine-protein kinase
MDDGRSTVRESLGHEQTEFDTSAEPDKPSSDVHDGSSNAAVVPRDDETLAGRYQLVRLLGCGTSSDVYEAIDLSNDATVALKRFREASIESLARIKSEFGTLAGIHAPGLVRFFDLVVSEDAAFFTMELVDGVPLTEYARTATTDALRTALGQVADAVGELHTRGHLHRDLKPANILVGRDGDVRVLDFGLADVVGIAGTPAYMAPELFEGRLPSPASDWYSFGAVIYEALAGRIPGAGTDIAEIVVRKQQRRFPTVRELHPEASSELGELAWQLLDPDPANRPERRAIAAWLLRQESSLPRPDQQGPVRQ